MDSLAVCCLLDGVSVVLATVATSSVSFRMFRALASSSSSLEGARGVVVIVVGNGHGDTSSNPGRD